MTTTFSAGVDARPGIDPRGPRFGAAVTTGVLAIALATITTPLAGVLLAVQAIVFAVGVTRGVAAQPYGVVFRRLVRPRLQPPTELEDPTPPRFAQGVGLTFALVALAAWLAGATAVAAVATGFALAAALLNAAFGLCLGCEMYLVARRLTTR